MIYDYYISGPMTGLPGYNYAAFNAAAAGLRLLGATVFNPADTFGGDHTRERKEYMRIDIQALLDSERVWMLEGWRNSVGARLEHDIATEIGLDIVYLDEVKETVLDEAKRIVYGERNESYGDPSDDFANIAKMWSVVFGKDVSVTQVGLAMACLKIARHLHKPKRDNLVDLAGYAACLERCESCDGYS